MTINIFATDSCSTVKIEKKILFIIF